MMKLTEHNTGIQFWCWCVIFLSSSLTFTSFLRLRPQRTSANWNVFFVIPFPKHRWCQSSAGGWWEPVSYLYGRHHWLCAARMWPHGHLHQMWQEDERVPHLQAVRCAGCACLQVLKKTKLYMCMCQCVCVSVSHMHVSRALSFITENKPPSTASTASGGAGCSSRHEQLPGLQESDCCLWPTMVLPPQHHRPPSD